MSTMCTVDRLEEGVCAVIVSYNPDISSLTKTLAQLKDQVAKVIIVDNHSSSDIVDGLTSLCARNPGNYSALFLSENVGIAAAQNMGIAEAAKHSCSHVLFMDHDSIPAHDMVSVLLRVEKTILSRGFKVGAVGPTLIDRRTQSKSGFVRKKMIFISRVFPEDCAEEFVEADFIISSGTLVRMSVLSDIGGMNSDYFIDHVDTEWCFRATNAGYKIYGAKDALLNHNLGEKVVKIWLGRWREIPRHNDFRYYYIFRNTLVMIKNVPMPFSWKIAHLYRLSIFLFFFGFICKASSNRWRFIIRGLADGIKTRMGQFKR